MKSLFSWLAIISGLLSAVCWIVSAAVKVKANGLPTHDGWGGGSVQSGDGNDVVQTLVKQSIWNSIAAMFAGVSAITQALATYL